MIGRRTDCLEGGVDLSRSSAGIRGRHSTKTRVTNPMRHECRQPQARFDHLDVLGYSKRHRIAGFPGLAHTY